MDALELMNFGWLSILPPLIAILLALITREVISSLLCGILAGALIYSNWNPVGMFETTFRVMGGRMGGNVNILIFLGLLGALVVIVTKGGGSAAYGNFAAGKIRTRKGACLATSALGALIFIDDYFNCLSVGTVMKPVTDKHRISRAKLAYLLDAMAAPVCIIAPVSSWGASVATYIEDAGAGSGMTTFIRTIPYNLYAILTIIMVIVICSTRIQFGPMAKCEKRAIETGDVLSAQAVSHEGEDGVPKKISSRGKVPDLILPIAALIVFTIIAMVYTGGGFGGEISFFASFGNSDSSLSLVLGSFAALVVTFFLYLPRKVLGFKEFMNGITEGVRSMVPAFTILILAWTIGGICSEEYLNTGGFVGGLVKASSFPVFILPVVIFLVAAFLGFATGTSWGTMALLIPIGAAICSADTAAHLLLPVLGAILAGAVFGDHISPISDTTILSSTGAGCNHMEHVTTQLPYASTAAGASMAGYLVIGITGSCIAGLLISAAVMISMLLLLDKIRQRKLPIQ